jgi:hypothetical protein
MPGNTAPAEQQDLSWWLLRNRVTLYVLLVLGSLVALPVGASAHGVPVGRAIYAWALLALCAAPGLVLRTFNSRYVLLLIFNLTYLVHFAGVDLQAILMGEDTPPPERTGFLTPA